MAEYVWIRLGEVAEYEKFDTPYDAGLEVKSVLAPFIPEAFYYRAAGVSVPPKFVSLNYISLFWGDEDAQWTRDLTKEEKRDFEKGVGEGIEGKGEIKLSGKMIEIPVKTKSKLTRDDVRVEVWEERDRLHIGIENKDTGDYLASWWDAEARQMFEDGFFKRERLKESVLSYAEEMGILQQ